jgi:hypothetical protein
MTAASIKALQDLQKTIVAFMDDLIEIFQEEGQFVALRIMVKDQIPITTIHRHFVNRLLPEKETIRVRNPSFFDRNVLFVQLGDDQAEKFRRLFLSLDKENQDVIWRWFDAFVILTEKCCNS